MKLSKKLKTDLFHELKQTDNAFGQADDYGNIMSFIAAIWNIDYMPSTDSRFETATNDIYQHIINNDDWDMEFLFLKRLELLDDNDVYKKFLETVVSPNFKSSEDEIKKFVVIINKHIEKEKYKLAIVSYNDNDLPIYNVRDKNSIGDLPIDIKVNDFKIYVEKNPTGYSHKASSHTRPNILPCLVYVFNNGWNDYQIKTSFDCFYYDNDGRCFYVGDVKIMSNEDIDTSNVIPDVITNLDDDFCSLGQKDRYYTNLKYHLDDKLESVLYALKDVSFFVSVLERFEDNGVFKTSLLRDDRVERLMREIKPKLLGRDLEDLYKFQYNFTPSYSNIDIPLRIEFDSDETLPNRLYSIIGKNGTGKTQLMNSLPLNLANRNEQLFNPHIPVFSKIITVSYSVFDSFPIPKKTASFNYIHCGLRDENGDFISLDKLIVRFTNTFRVIRQKKRVKKWLKILRNFISEDIFEVLLVPVEEFVSENEYKVTVESFGKIRNRLSSGESILLFIISEIVANIRFDSLILYDEPETHLHPNAITSLLNAIYDLLDEFESYCIISTHSPLIIREMLSKNVYILERHENVPSLRKISKESFGENLSVLTDEVFGNKNVEMPYKTVINKLVRSQRSYRQIVNLLETDGVQLSTNSKIYIKSILRNGQS